MTPTSDHRVRRSLLATAALTLVAATALVLPTGTTGAQAPEAHTFATFDAPVDNIVTGELNGVGFELVSVYEGVTEVNDPVTVTSCDLSGTDYSPAGPADGRCANTWARATYTVTFDEPVEGLRVYLQGLRGEQGDAGGSYEYDITPNGLGCDDPEICWEIQSGLTGTEPYEPFDGYLVTTEVGLVNGVLFVGPSVDAVSELRVHGDAGPNDISLMGVTFAVPAQDPEPTTITPGPTTTAAPGPNPTTTAPTGKPVTPRYTG